MSRMAQADKFVPPTHERRTLVLVFDGTGDQFDDDNSNMVRFFAMLKKDNRDQLVYYQSGIGTYLIPQVAKPWFAKLTRTIDSMIAKSLHAHVMGGYEFLMQNYQAGDAICVFGFSRGAYTARALAGMIHKVGLLPMSNHQQVAFAYSMYARDDVKGWEQSAQFKKAFSIDVEIQFLGVWDTVGSVGVIPKRLPFTTSNSHVRYFRHAVALDERRARFMPYFWNPPFPPNQAPPRHHYFHRNKTNQAKSKEEKKPKMHEMEKEFEFRHIRKNSEHADCSHQTDVQEVWFAGCHCDVGGGNVPNETPHSLARISLRWMIRQCFLCNTGIMFDKELFAEAGMDWNTLWPEVKPRPPMLRAVNNRKLNSESPISVRPMDHDGGSDEERSRLAGIFVPRGMDEIDEEEEDLRDALCPAYDQLKISRLWWFLELIPLRQRVLLEDKLEEHKRKKAGSGSTQSRKKLMLNLGRGRFIPRQSEGLHVHRTVELRMEASEAGLLRKPKSKKMPADGSMDLSGKKYSYVPRAKWVAEPTWVD